MITSRQTKVVWPLFVKTTELLSAPARSWKSRARTESQIHDTHESRMTSYWWLPNLISAVVKTQMFVSNQIVARWHHKNKNNHRLLFELWSVSQVAKVVTSCLGFIDEFLWKMSEVPFKGDRFMDRDKLKLILFDWWVLLITFCTKNVFVVYKICMKKITWW